MRASRRRAAPAPSAEGTLVIRAHGIPPGRRARLAKLPVRLVDATCPDVARIHGLIKRHAAHGFAILIFGDPGHARGGRPARLRPRPRTVVTRPGDVRALPARSACACVRSPPSSPRTTPASPPRRAGGSAEAVVLDTICDATKNRQRELVRIAGRTDALVVVGSRHSANTLRLVRLARRLRPTFHIETAEESPPRGCAGSGRSA